MKNRLAVELAMLLMCLPFIAAAAENPIEVEKVAAKIYCIRGAGGNITVVQGPKALLVVDSGYAKTADEVVHKIREIDARPVSYLINTHHHGDHTGGNAAVGGGAQILAHENCRKAMLEDQKLEKRVGDVAVPSSIDGDEKALDLGGMAVRLIHPGPAHTGGDIIVIVGDAKVIVAGDVFFNGIPPFIDVKNGSDTKSWIHVIRKLAAEHPDFRIIPGHGPIADMPAFVRFAEYLQALRDKVAAAIAAGKSREETMASVALDDYADLNENQFLSRRSNLGWVFDEMTR
jgi:cyclase